MGVALWRNMGVVVVIISWSSCQTKGRKPTNRLTAYNYNCWPILEVSWGDPSRTERSRPKTVWPMQWINYSLCHVQSLSTLGASSPVQRFGPKITSYTHLTPEKISLNELGLWTICHGFFFRFIFLHGCIGHKNSRVHKSHFWELRRVLHLLHRTEGAKTTLRCPFHFV